MVGVGHGQMKCLKERYRRFEMTNDLTIPIAKYEISFIDDPYLRPSFVIYCCGCPHRCKNCQNKELQDAASPLCTQVQVEDVCNFIKMIDRNFIDCIVYLGGDFGLYKQQYYLISKAAKECGFQNILYTGYKFENLDYKFKKYTDIIIDGKYKEDQKQNIFPASKNQRIWQKISDNWVIINPIDLPINKEQAKQGGANEI